MPTSKNNNSQPENIRRIAYDATINAIGSSIQNYINNTDIKKLELMLTRGVTYDVVIKLLESEALNKIELSPFQESKLKGIQVKKDLLNHHGGVVDTADVMSVLNCTKQTVHHKRRNGTLLGFKNGNSFLYPVFQFEEAGIIPGLAKVIKALHEQDSDFWESVLFILNGNDYLTGSSDIPISPLDMIKKGELGKVMTSIEQRLMHTA